MFSISLSDDKPPTSTDIAAIEAPATATPPASESAPEIDGASQTPAAISPNSSQEIDAKESEQEQAAAALDFAVAFESAASEGLAISSGESIVDYDANPGWRPLSKAS